MPLNSKGEYRRPQLRNKAVNYRYGWFFVTFQVAMNKTELGAITGRECRLNELGKAVARLVETLHDFNPEVYVDSFVVMPNHVHLILKIADRPANDTNHLAKIMRKLKSLAAREYRLLKERGLARDIGTKLWQANYWEKIVTTREQLEGYRRYIAANPANWSRDRFGPVTSHRLGNTDLLGERLVAFVASQDGGILGGAAVAPRKWESGAVGPRAGGNAPAPREELGATPPLSENKITTGADAPVVISTFTSPQEREVLRRLIAAKRRFIAVYPGGIPGRLPPAVADAVAAGRALLLSPAEPGTGVNKQRAVWCNEFVIRNAAEIWHGAISPGGTLAAILKGFAR